MKEHKSALLVLSAFAALALTACAPEAPQGSTPSQSDAGSASSVVSDASASVEESSASLPSSTAAEDLDNWAGQAWVGQYQGGFTTLIINEDMSTSFDTDKTHYPAQIEVMDNGIFHIFSTNVVPAAERVDVYTDGVMAYFWHDSTAKDRYIVDKNASYEGANGFAKNANGSLIIGSIQLTNKTKFFCYKNGAYDFNAQVSLTYGESIQALGAFFDVTVGGQKSSYHTIEAGDAESNTFAIIEDYNLEIFEYEGDDGLLVIAKNGNQIAFVTLGGADIDLNDVTVGNGSITIKDGEPTLDKSDNTDIAWVYPATEYILGEFDYTKANATSRVSAFPELDMTQSTYSVTVGADGNLWASFTPTVSGFFTVEEIVSTSSDGYISIYKSTAAAYTDSYSGSHANTVAYADSGAALSGAGKITNVLLYGGITYIIKAGYYADAPKDIGATGSTYAGNTETISYSWSPFTVTQYADEENHALEVLTYQGEFKGVMYDGVAIENAVKSGNTISAENTVYDYDTNPTNPEKVITTLTITIDPDTMSFTYLPSTVREPIFHVFTEADSGTQYSAVVGEDGNLWAVFTPTSAGYLTVEEIQMTGTDGYLSIYESTATKFTDDYNHSYCLYYNDDMATGVRNAKISNAALEANKTYVIKAGALGDRGRELGDTGSTNAGKTETISFIFSSFECQTFDGANGELVIFTNNGEIQSATINGAAVENPELVDNGDNTLTLTSVGAGTLDTTDPLDPIRNSTDTVYTIDAVAHSYTVASVPNSRHFIQEIPSNTTQTTVSAVVDGDGNLWAKFTPTVDGYLTVEESQSTVSDGYIAVYLPSASPFTSTSSAVKTGDYNSTHDYNWGRIADLQLTAGQTYIIKAGAYSDRALAIGATTSANKGKVEEISFEFNAIETATYTNDNGGADLVIKKAGNTVIEAKLGTTVIANAAFDEDGNLYIAGTATVNNTDPLNPLRESTDTVYELDESNGKYVLNSVPKSEPIFHEVTGTEEITAVVGADGNLWIKFTAPSDGTIDIEELSVPYYYGCIGIYASNATAFTSTYALEEHDMYYSYDYSADIYDFEVLAGQTYIIKAGSSYDNSKTVVSTGSSYAGKTVSIGFTFNTYATLTYTNSDGADLVIATKGNTITSAMLGDQRLEGAAFNADGNIVIEDVIENDGEGHINMVDYTFTLDNENNTYEVARDVTEYLSSDNLVIASTGTYFFAYDQDQNAYTSNNAGQGSSTATMTITINEDGYLSLDYFCSAEGGNYDNLEIKRGNTALTTPATLGSEAGVSGNIFIEVHAGDVITITFKKDSSVNKGKDCAIISNILLLTEVPANQE